MKKIKFNVNKFTSRRSSDLQYQAALCYLIISKLLADFNMLCFLRLLSERGAFLYLTKMKNSRSISWQLLRSYANTLVCSVTIEASDVFTITCFVVLRLVFHQRAEERDATRSVASIDVESFLSQSYQKTEQHHNS